MTISKTTAFKVKAVHDSPNETPFIDFIFTPSGKQLTLSGVYLEAQFAVGNDFILFITDDCPFEERLSIYYLDPAAELLDSLQLCVWYTPGILTNLRIKQPNQLHFSFFDASENWVLSVLSKPEIQFWANSHPITRKRPFMHKAYFNLEECA
jgi:hypothetical protein